MQTPAIHTGVYEYATIFNACVRSPLEPNVDASCWITNAAMNTPTTPLTYPTIAPVSPAPIPKAPTIGAEMSEMPMNRQTAGIAARIST